ncbi:yif-1 [Pristionchus pacificus]|uniref:Protein YIF1 n=1 Tax=Pristionchus pacificus TaxID=54126 RepID=A0A2A6CRF2_PRIPA|nr:yif-1 [Pristionchus pacificus]|eukprot:PDM80637.1 yif-1 [Pristionchus pacificus]
MAQGWDNSWDNQNQWNQPQQDYNQYGNQYGSAYGAPQPPQQQQQQQHQQQQQSYGQSSGPYAEGYGLPQGASQFMADPMFKAAQQFGGQFAEQQKDKLVKYLNPFQLKYYFSVDNAYVGKKLGLILFPFFHSDWAPKFSHDNGPVSAREDINAPDLYIPLMAFLTYVLVSGFVLGTQSRFSPEIFGILTSNALVLSLIENVIINIAKMTLCLLAFIFGGKSIYYAVLAYTSAALVFFLLRTVANFFFDAHYTPDGRKRKGFLILFILITQPFIMWWLTSGVTNFDYKQYEFASKAMGNLGMKGKDVPMTGEGEVDYEALLKLPKS